MDGNVLGCLDPKAHAELQDQMFSSRDLVRACRAQVMERSDRAIEYFEDSFLVESGPGQLYHLDEIMLERGTIPLTDANERCVLDAFLEFRLELSAAPEERIRFPFCFND